MEGHSNQHILEAALDVDVSAKEYESHFKHMRTVGRERGIDYILEKYSVDVILGPADSLLPTLASASGKATPSSTISILRCQIIQSQPCRSGILNSTGGRLGSARLRERIKKRR